MGEGGGMLDFRDKKRKREVSTRPERSLDAPGFSTDHRLNLLAWSSDNIVAVPLGRSVWLWDAGPREVKSLGR